jgi:hypothetical protein
MEHVKAYINQNRMEMNDIFRSMAVDNELEATKVFLFVQNAFKFETLKFTLHGKNYF